MEEINADVFKHNKECLINWGNVMNKNGEAVTFLIAYNNNGELVFYTSLQNNSQVLKVLIDSINLISNSKEIIKLT